jgi:Ca2+-binding RTX toxin-like protein
VDRLQGGNGDDMLLGGYGRDLAWTGKPGWQAQIA